jgi:hypothetical protein
MTPPPDHKSYGPWLQVVPIVTIAVLGILLWRPAGETLPTQEQLQKIDDLARQLGSTSRSPSDIDDRLRSFGPFPPDAHASRALADALMTCETARLDEPQRKTLARQLYAITITGDIRRESVVAALMSVQSAMATTGCSPAAVDVLVSAAHDVARTDPHPRRDWW